MLSAIDRDSLPPDLRGKYDRAFQCCTRILALSDIEPRRARLSRGRLH
jgi:hypothetical protein